MNKLLLLITIAIAAVLMGCTASTEYSKLDRNIQAIRAEQRVGFESSQAARKMGFEALSDLRKEMSIQHEALSKKIGSVKKSAVKPVTKVEPTHSLFKEEPKKEELKKEEPVKKYKWGKLGL